VEAGAQYIVTRPVYDLDSLRRLREALGEPVPLLVSVRALRSFAQAEYLAHEVPDLAVPASALDLLERAGDRAADAGVELAAELVRGVRAIADGVVLALPEDPAAATELLAAARGE
jgi:homocysteine S-methyltransferase